MMTDNRNNNLIPFFYVAVSGTLGNGASGQTTLVMAADSEFELHYVLGSCTQDADTDFMPNNFSCQIVDQSTGRQLSNVRVPQRNLVGPSNGSIFQRRPVIWPPNSNILFDFLNLTANDNVVSLTLVGYKIFLR